MPQNLFDLPAPEGNPLTGNLLDFGRDPLGFLMRCRDYGDRVPLRFGWMLACLLSDPEGIEQVLRDQDTFLRSRAFRVLKALLGDGLLTAERESWLWQRRLVQPVFHHQRIHAYGSIMVAQTERMLQDWRNDERRDIHADMMQLTLQIVMKCIFNTEIEEQESQTIAHALDVAIHWFESKRRQYFLVWEWLPQPENRRYHRAIAQMNRTIDQLIRDRRRTLTTDTDLLSLLMAARDQDTGEQMSDRLLRDEVAALMLAGHESTANTLTWTWMLLAQHPQVRRKLDQELQQVLSGRSPTVEDLPALRYTQQIVKEALRLYPAVAILGRKAARECCIGDSRIPGGTEILISQWVLHRDPRYFADPEAFCPERWTEDFEKHLPRGLYIPFGHGPRVCIGRGFAQMEAVLLLAAIAQQFEMTLEPGFPIVPQCSITLRPQYGLQVRLKQQSRMPAEAGLRKTGHGGFAT